MLSLVLLLGGLCGGLCFAQAAHSCCHGENHCGHPGPAMLSHQAPAISQIVPVTLMEPVLVSPGWFAASDPLVQPHPLEFSPPLRTSVLRL
jgi:hypothetical protein